MVGWLVFLGIYQIFLAWKFGTFFEGTTATCATTSAARARAALRGHRRDRTRRRVGRLAPAPVGVPASFILQGLIYLLMRSAGSSSASLGKPAPDRLAAAGCAFGAYNLWWLTRPDMRRAFARPTRPG